MKHLKRDVRILYVDDNVETLNQLRQLTEVDFPTAEVTTAEKLGWGFRGLYAYSLAVIDISAVCEDSLHPEWAYAPIRFFMREYPTPNILIVSAMSIQGVCNFVDDLKKYVDADQADRIHVGGWIGNWKLISQKIKDLHPATEYNL